MEQNTNINRDEVDINNIMYYNTFNLHNNDNRYMKVTLKSKLIKVGRWLISIDYREF